jgi:hypothetical protein
MTSINKFDSSVYSEEIAPVISEREYDEVMGLIADDDFGGYAEWSASLESPVVAESENFVALANGQVHHKPEPKSNGRVAGIEV